MNTETPLTDAEAERYEKSEERKKNACWPYSEVPADFARSLERRNAELTAENKRLNGVALHMEACRALLKVPDDEVLHEAIRELTARIAELEASLSAQRDSTALYQSQLKRLCELAKNYQARVLLSQVAQNDYRMYQCAENATAVSEASCAECDAMEAVEGLIKAVLPATPLPESKDDAIATEWTK